MANLTLTTATNFIITTTVGGRNSSAVSGEVADDRSVVEIVFLSALVGIVLLTSLLGNLLVIVCIRWDRRLRRETGNVFLVNLSVTDMTSAVVVMTSSVVSLVSDGWPFSGAWCDVVCIMNYVLIIVSMLTLCFVSLDRYAAVIHALKYHVIVTKRRALALIAFAWLQGLSFGLTPALLDWVQYDYWEMVCAIDWAQDSLGTLIYVLAAFTLCFVTPGIVLVVAYFKVMAVANSISPARRTQKTGTFVSRRRMGQTQNHPTSSHTGTRITSADEETWSVESRSNGVRLELTDVGAVQGQATRDDKVSPSVDQQQTRRPASSASSTTNGSANRLGVSFVGLQGGVNRDEEKGSSLGRDGLDETNYGGDEDDMTKEIANGVSQKPRDSSSIKNLRLNLSVTERNYCHLSSPSSERTGDHLVEFVNSTTSAANEDNKCSPNVHVIASPALFKNTDTTIPSTTSKEKPVRYSSSNRAIRSLLIVVVAFFICMTPFCITKVYKVIMQNDDALPGYVNVLATIFQYCSSAINPLIYGIFRKDFQHVFRKLLKRWFCGFSISRSAHNSDTFSY